MALSEEEQLRLAQLEESLAAEDPKLAHTLRGTTPRTLHGRRATLAGAGFLLGIAMLIGGMQVSPWISIAGFVVMLASVIVGLTAWQHVNDVPPAVGPRPPQEGAFMDKMEERWRRRQEDGF